MKYKLLQLVPDAGDSYGDYLISDKFSDDDISNTIHHILEKDNTLGADDIVKKLSQILGTKILPISTLSVNIDKVYNYPCIRCGSTEFELFPNYLCVNCVDKTDLNNQMF